MSDHYQPLRETLPPLELDVRIPNRLTGAVHRVHISCRHLLYHEFAGLDDLLIGEIAVVADPTGLQLMEAMAAGVPIVASDIHGFKRVVERISNLDPSVYAGGEITGKEEVEKWIDAPENADAVYAAWIVYERSIDNPPTKSADEGGVDRSGEDAGESEVSRSFAQLSTV